MIAIGVNPNGFNINKNCGSTFPEKIKSAVKKHKAHLGISLDVRRCQNVKCNRQTVTRMLNLEAV